MKEYVGGSHIFFVGECVIHHCVFTIAMVVFVINICLFINVFIYLFIYVKKEFIVHTVIYQLSPLQTEFKSIQF